VIASEESLDLIGVKVEALDGLPPRVVVVCVLPLQVLSEPLVHNPGCLIAKKYVYYNIFIIVALFTASGDWVTDRYVAEQATINEHHIFDVLRLECKRDGC